MCHLRPPTRVRKVELIKQWEPKKVTDSPLRHHHLKTANIPRRGDLYTSRIPMLFNQERTGNGRKPPKGMTSSNNTKTVAATGISSFFKAAALLGWISEN